MKRYLVFLLFYLYACLGYSQISGKILRNLIDQQILPIEVPYADEATALTDSIENSAFYLNGVSGWDIKKGSGKNEDGTAYQVLLSKTFSIPPAWKGKQLFLLIEPITTDIVITVNNQPLTCCQHNPRVTIPVSSLMNAAEENRLEISLASTKPVNNVKELVHQMGLFATPQVHISYFANHYAFGSSNRINYYPGYMLEHYYQNFGDSTWYTYQANTRLKIYNEDKKLIDTWSSYRSTKKPSIVYSEGIISTGKHNVALSRWTAETPQFYLMTIQNLSSTEEVKEVFFQKTGFIESVIKDQKLFINRVPVQIKAVAVPMQTLSTYTKEELTQLILTLKTHHVNTLVVSGFLQNRMLYELCDKYGLYIIHTINGNDYIDGQAEAKKTANELKHKLLSNLYLLKNRPSLIAWYVELDTKWKHLLQSIADTLRLIESARPVIYSNHQIENLPVLKDIPVLKIPLQQNQWLMLKKKFEWINFTVSSYKENILTLTNTYDFMALDSVMLQWEIVDTHQVLEKGNIESITVLPHKSYQVSLPFNLSAYKDKPTITFRFTILLKHSTAWLEQGTQLASKNLKFTFNNNNYYLEEE